MCVCESKDAGARVWAWFKSRLKVTSVRVHMMLTVFPLALLAYVLLFPYSSSFSGKAVLYSACVLGVVVSLFPKAVGGFLVIATGCLGVLGSADSTVTALLLALAVIVLAARKSFIAALSLSLMGALAGSVGLLLSNGSLSLLMLDAIASLLLLYAPAVGAGLAIYYWRARQQAVLEGLREKQRRERRYIAADLHDTVARDLTHAIFAIEAALDTAPEDVTEALEKALESNRIALDGLRYTMRFMREDSSTPERVQKVPLSETVQEWVEQLHTAGYDVSKDGEGDLDVLPTWTREITRRVFTEGCVNILRHGQPGSCEIFLEVGDEQVNLAMSNEASMRTFVLSNKLGLAGLTEIVQSAGGVLKGTQVGKRWMLNASIPNNPLVKANGG